MEFDNSLGVAVRKVRDALHDSAEEPRYLETIPKRGYRFLGRVENLGLAPPQIQSQPEAVPARVAEVEPHVVAPAGRLFHPVYWILIGMVVVSAGVAFYVFRGKPKSSSAVLSSAQPVRVRRSIALLGFRNLRGRPEDNWLSAAFEFSFSHLFVFSFVPAFLTGLVNTFWHTGNSGRRLPRREIMAARFHLSPARSCAQKLFPLTYHPSQQVSTLQWLD